MDKNLHNIDEIFNEAHKHFEEQPSNAVWEKLQASLDKQNADKYKRQTKEWKRIAILLILLLGSFIIYEILIITRQKEISKNHLSTKTKAEKNNTSKVNTKSLNNDNSKQETNKKNIMKEKNLSETTLDKHKRNNSKYDNDHSDSKNMNSLKNPNLHDKSNISLKNKIYGEQNSKILKTQFENNKKKRLMIFDEQLKKIKEFTQREKPSFVDNTSTTAETIKLRLLNKIHLTQIQTQLIYQQNIILPKSSLLPVIDNITTKISKKSKENFKPYWTVTPFISNNWTYNHIDNDLADNTGNNLNEKDEINKREREEFSFSTGALFTRQLSKHFSIKTGIIYSNSVIAISPQEIYAKRKIDDGTIAYKYITSSGYGYVKPDFGLPPSIGDSIEASEAHHNLQSISIPLSVSWRIDKKKFSIIPSFGFTANFISNAAVKTEISDALNKEKVDIIGLDGINRFYAGFMADINLQYSVSKKLSLNLLPNFKHALSSITKNYVVKTYPYSFGIGAGLTFKF
jgi:hypothetical protein